MRHKLDWYHSGQEVVVYIVNAGIPWLFEDLLSSQEDICTVELVNHLIRHGLMT